jgi:hypothetical protein
LRKKEEEKDGCPVEEEYELGDFLSALGVHFMS